MWFWFKLFCVCFSFVFVDRGTWEGIPWSTIFILVVIIGENEVGIRFNFIAAAAAAGSVLIKDCR